MRFVLRSAHMVPISLVAWARIPVRDIERASPRLGSRIVGKVNGAAPSVEFEKALKRLVLIGAGSREHASEWRA